MIFKDRIPTLPNRRKITHADGTAEYATIEYADEPTEQGTPLNAANLNNINTELIDWINNSDMTICRKTDGTVITDNTVVEVSTGIYIDEICPTTAEETEVLTKYITINPKYVYKYITVGTSIGFETNTGTSTSVYDMTVKIYYNINGGEWKSSQIISINKNSSKLSLPNLGDVSETDLFGNGNNLTLGIKVTATKQRTISSIGGVSIGAFYKTEKRIHFEKEAE